MQEKSELKRGLGLLDATCIVIGSMIGSGIFIVSADMARVLGSPGWLLVAWVVTGLITIAAALSYGELAGMFPQAGGQYVYLREAYGKLPAFLYGWTLFSVIQTGTVAAVCVATSKFTGVIFPFISSSNWLVRFSGFRGYDIGLNTENLFAIFIMIFLTWINTKGLSYGKLIQNVFTFAKLLSLFGLIIFVLFFGRNAYAISQNIQDFWGTDSLNIKEVVHILPLLGVAMVGSLFSSDAWNNVTFTAGEIKNPKRDIPLSLALGSITVTLLYVLVNIAYLCALPLQGIQFATSDRVGSAALEITFGSYGSVTMAILIMIATFGCANGMTLAGARVYYAMAKDNLFFKTAGKTNKNSVPENALFLQCLWTCVLCLSGTYSNLLDYVIFAVLIFYILTIFGLFILRIKRPGVNRPYKAFGYPIIPVLYILFAALIAIDLLVYKPNYTWPGFLIVLIGVPIYYLWQKK